MDLKTYLSKNKISNAAFAKEIKCSPALISYLCQKKRTPSLKIVQKIAKLTKNKVTAKDFFKK